MSLSENRFHHRVKARGDAFPEYALGSLADLRSASAAAHRDAFLIEPDVGFRGEAEVSRAAEFAASVAK
jgi:hypothetical protein